MWDGLIIDGAVLQISNFEIAFASFKSSQYIFILTDVLTCNCLNRKKNNWHKVKIQKKMFLVRNTGYITEKWSVLLINKWPSGFKLFLKSCFEKFSSEPKIQSKIFLLS